MPLLIAIALIVVLALALGIGVVGIVRLKQGAEPGSPVDEFCGGTEALDEIHTLFDGIYARWNGLGPWEAPLDMPDEERAVWTRERRYARLGWIVTDIVVRGGAWLSRRFGRG